MTIEQNSPDETAPTTSEEVAASEDDAAQTTPDASLNRAERRAQAKGKKGNGSGGAGFNPGQTANPNARTSGNRIGGAVGQNRLPRTGNK